MFCIQCGASNVNEAKFCSSCGKSITQSVSTELQNKSDNSHSLSNFTLIAEGTNCFYGGKDGTKLDKSLGKSMGVEWGGGSHIKNNIYASPEFLIIVPVSKDKSSIALFGLLLGTHALGAVAMTALSHLANRIEGKNAKVILESDNPFYNAIIFNTKDIQVKVKETKLGSDSLFDNFKRATHFRFIGDVLHKNSEYSVIIQCGFEGQASNPNKKRMPFYDDLFNTLKIPPSPIFQGKQDDVFI
jgi:hypothetical protein